jgi:hypothetical protein
VSEFAFEIQDALVLDDRGTKVTLIGPVVDPTGGLSVGDEISVPFNNGVTEIRECSLFRQSTLVRDGLIGFGCPSTVSNRDTC